jgi:hypothetical protein
MALGLEIVSFYLLVKLGISFNLWARAEGDGKGIEALCCHVFVSIDVPVESATQMVLHAAHEDGFQSTRP